MSVSAVLPSAPSWRRPVLRVTLVAVALALAVGLLAALSALVAPSIAAPPPRSPFGVGFREAMPSTTGIAGRILAIQSQFGRALQDGVLALKTGRAGTWPLVALAFVYGIFHAAGPGHGKAVIAGYILADERALRRGFALSAAAAILQAVVALGLVGIAAVLLRATAPTMNAAGDVVEKASFALVAAVGAVMLWRKSARVAEAFARSGPQGLACDHVHLTDGVALARLGTWQERVGVVLAAGTRPCAGAVLILVFALSQGVFVAGVAAVFAMALGTAITTGALAAVAVFAKVLALKVAGTKGRLGSRVLAFGELCAAAFVLTLGSAMLAGLMIGTGN